MKIAKRNASAARERSPPESSEIRLTRLRPGTRLDLDPRLERVRRVRQHEPPFAAGEELLHQSLELRGDVPERSVEGLLDLTVDLGHELEEVPTCLPDVVELALHEVVPLLDRPRTLRSRGG